MKKQNPEDIRVAFCPGDASNPYIRSLSEQVRRLGCEVIPAPPSTLLLFKSRAARRANVVHLHWPDYYMFARSWPKTVCKSLLFLAQLVFIRLRGGRIVWTAHNLASHEATHPRTQRFWTRRLISLCNAVLAHNQACADAVVEHFRIRRSSKVRVIPHANYVDDYPQGADRQTARNHVGVDEEDFVFLFIGAIRGYKGVFEMIENFGRLKEAGVKLIVAGKPFSDQLDQSLRGLAEATPGVLYHNEFVPPDEMQFYMAAADVVVLPYRRIFTSGTLMLAASFSKPVIAPDVPTLIGSVDPKGIIPYDRHDGGAVLKAMREALADRAALEARGKAAHRGVASWGWAEMAAATVEAYRG